MPLHPRKKKKVLFAAIAVAGAVLFLEIFSSWALMLRMRIENTEDFAKSEPTYFSLLNIPYEAGVRFGLFDRVPQFEMQIEPNTEYASDAEFGYKKVPGKYRAILSRRAPGSSEWKRIVLNETINKDGTRWTGECKPNSNATLYILGESFVEGFGVNDEQTFSFLLQQARKDVCIKLFAVAGYSMTQSFIRFNKLRNQIKRNDIIIVGYADFSDLRTVVAPSRLSEHRAWFKDQGRSTPSGMWPKATLDAQGGIHISYIQVNCDENGGYCDQRDQTKDEMARTTAALINQIAKTTDASVYLLHFDGRKDNPIFGLLSGSVHRISALPEDFNYYIRDDILGIDSHPGPYWHYAISRKLIEALPIPLQANGDSAQSNSQHD